MSESNQGGEAPVHPEAAGEKERRDILTPTPEEERELARFVDGGHRSGRTMMVLGFFGIFVFLVALLYWDRLDLSPQPGTGEWQAFGTETLPGLVRTQHLKETKTYRLQPGLENPPPEPIWPEIMYNKLRADIYIIGGMMLVLCWVLVRMERARARRSDLLAFRALAREIEKLRLRIRELEQSGALKRDSKDERE